MDIINENYHTGYKLKLDKNNYCYYADETNRNIIIKLISDYRKDILGEGCISCKDEIARFMGRLEHGPFVCILNRLELPMTIYMNIVILMILMQHAMTIRLLN